MNLRCYSFQFDVVQVGISLITFLLEPNSEEWTYYFMLCFWLAWSFYIWDVIYSVYCDIKNGHEKPKNVVAEEKIEAKIAEQV